MDAFPTHFKVSMSPIASADAVVQTDHARFTVLTPRMIRMEWSPDGKFEDRSSQAFWFREQPVPQFSMRRDDYGLVIETDYLRFMYKLEEPFSAETLRVELKSMDSEWHYGDSDPSNLGGTARTLDEVDGATPLGFGLVSRAGWSVVDDSISLVFNDEGWLEPREAPEGQLDLYFMGYGHDYGGCLREFSLVSGAVPMIPRYVLGNWWSRYWDYTQEELLGLMDDFKAYQTPLSVCIIDMDWHITNTGNASSGWTGYTWNRELFPDPEGALRLLHEKGLMVALNLHPALGVFPHEEMYAEMADAVGQDPAEGEPVEFDITNPRFVEAYFRILHHPQEARGVDFWWMDWQQGARTRLSGLDPLWWLNHLHFLDLGRDGKRRSFIFSRWGGLGNHRYPIGFSGDSVVSWASLAFQPYFTATSSNVNYGWWSHDIGGHMGGIEDAELYTRWVQMGVFQPVLRLHSTKNPFHERRPWGYDEETLAAAREAMQLRHALIPYLYSLAWRFHRESIPPILPMYYAHPEQEEAYACPNQYHFGDALIAAPFIQPMDTDTRLSRSVVWLPEGDWYHFFNGEFYSGGGWHAVYGTLRDTPVFAKAGAIVPQGPMVGWGGVEAPERLTVNVFAGADGSFDLYEDEGNSNAYLEGEYAVTPLRMQWSDNTTLLTVGPADGNAELLPVERTVDLRLVGFRTPGMLRVTRAGETLEMEYQYDPSSATIHLTGIVVKPDEQLEVKIESVDEQVLADRTDARLEQLRRMLTTFRMESWSKHQLLNQLAEVLDDAGLLVRYSAIMRPSQIRAMMETITGAGIDYTESTGDPLVVVWNNNNNANVTHQFSLARLHHFWRQKERYPWYNKTAPRFQSYHPKAEFGEGNSWYAQLSYYGFGTVRVGKE